MSKSAQTQYPILDLLKDRWSPRAFSAQPVAQEELLQLFEAARWSPSAANTQPWYFIVATQSNQTSHQKLVETLLGQNLVWAKNAPVLVLVVAKLNPERPAFNRFAFYDVGQAVAHLSVQASAQGLYVHQMGGFDAAKARQLFEITEDYEPITVVAIGQLGNAEELPAELQEREIAERSRKSLTEFVFDGEWGQPLPKP
jgi:nitroreductase